MNVKIKVKDLDTQSVEEWPLEQVLAEINRDHSSEWTDYTESDWEEGWDTWVEGDGFYTRKFKTEGSL